MYKIAVVGDQSSGKSSLIESMFGFSLPRGEGIVTRTPIQVRSAAARLRPRLRRAAGRRACCRAGAGSSRVHGAGCVRPDACALRPLPCRARRRPPACPHRRHRALQVEHRFTSGEEHAEISYRRDPDDVGLVRIKIDDLDQIEKEVRKASVAEGRGEGAREGRAGGWRARMHAYARMHSKRCQRGACGSTVASS